MNAKRELADRSDELLNELRYLKTTEELKRQQPISSPPFHALADEVEASSRRIFTIAQQQDALGEASPTGEVTIEDLSETG